MLTIKCHQDSNLVLTKSADTRWLVTALGPRPMSQPDLTGATVWPDIFYQKTLEMKPVIDRVTDYSMLLIHPLKPNIKPFCLRHSETKAPWKSHGWSSCHAKLGYFFLSNMIETMCLGTPVLLHFRETLGTSRRFGFAPRVPDIRACRSASQQGHHSEPGDCDDLWCWPCWPTGRISLDLVVQLVQLTKSGNVY